MPRPVSPIRTASNRPQRGGRVLLLAGAVAVLAVLIAQLPAWMLAELRAFDYLSTLDAPPPPADGPIVVAIDEPSLADINAQWPWPRDIHARLVERLRAAGAVAIGLDIIFAEPSEPAADAALAAALGPDVVLAADESVIVTPQAEQVVRAAPLPAFTARGAATGIASITLGRDGIFRDMPRHADGFARVLARVAGREAAAAGPLLLQSFGPARSYPTVSYYQALDPENMLPQDTFRGRVVIVGLSLQNAPALSAGGADAFATPHTVRSGRLVAGAEIQAAIFDNLTRGAAITPAGPPLSAGAIVLAALLSAAAVRRATRWRTAIAALAAPFLIAGTSYLLLRHAQVYVPPLAPVAAFLMVAAAQAALDYAEERRRRAEIVRAFSQYLSPALVARLADDPSQLRLGGERRTLSVLFCDVRGFTTIAETMKDDPEQLTALVNRLLTPLSDVVLRHGGTIDKYIGDCLMAFWNAPLDDPDHAVHAVAAALDMLEAIGALNEELLREGAVQHALRIGIGINTGDCVVGNMGSARRFDYSVLGDTVNLASRLEGASKAYGVPLLVGAETARRAADGFAVLELDRIAVKGRTAEAPVFTVLRSVPEAVLAEHARVLSARRTDTLDGADPALARLAAALPGLGAYYEGLRAGHGSGGA